MVRLAPLFHEQAFTVVRSTIVKETADWSVTNLICVLNTAKFGSFFVSREESTYAWQLAGDFCKR